MSVPKSRCRNDHTPYNPVLEEIRDLSAKLAQANAALAQHCACLFTQGGFHKATCPYHEQMFKELEEARDQVAFLSQKRP